MKLAQHLEALLYLKARPLSLTELEALTGFDGGTITEALIALMGDYARRDSALEVVETSQGYSLQLRPSYQSLVEQFIPTELSTGSLRTLAAIALKQPILQTDLIDLRGSSAYQQVQELVSLGFVSKRPQSEGRSFWLEVTEKFQQYFEIDELSQLLP